MVDYVTSSGPVTSSDTSVTIAGGVAIGTTLSQTAFTWSPTSAGTFRLYGTLYSRSFALDITGADSDVIVEASGSIATQNTAIQGALRTLTNFGSIGCYVESRAAVFTVRNYGTIIDNFSNAIDHYGSGTSSIFNAGSIIGSKDAIRLESMGNSSIVNTGTITSIGTSSNSVLIETFGATTITNYGLIAGGAGYAIETDDQADIIVNAGLINGLGMFLYDGNDRYDTSRGTVTGTVDLGSGDDIGIGGDAADRIFGGADRDELTGNGGDDVLNGGDGDDRITGGSGDDTLDGGTGNDRLDGNSGDDRLTGGTGNDQLNGGSGSDTMTGGADDDVYYVDDARDRVIEAANEGNDTIYASVSYTLLGGQAVETLAVDPAFVSVAVSLTGNALAQTIQGGEGDDRLTGGGGADTLIGGKGDDVYYVSSNGVTIRETGSDYDKVFSTVSYTLTANLEELRAADPHATAALALTGNALDNVIIGNVGANVIDGGGGADRMVGGAGNDTYYVDTIGDVVNDSGGRDTVHSIIDYTLGRTIETLILDGSADIDATGNADANTITGNDGANVLSGRGGIDMLTGGLGDDIFLFATKATAGTLATITDFGTGADRIALDDAAFRRIGGPGILDDSFFTDGAATTRDHHILFDSATGTLSYDIDGSGTAYAAVAFAVVDPGVTLTAADILVV